MSALFVSKNNYNYNPCRLLQTCRVHESQCSSCRLCLVCLVVHSMSYHTHSCCYRSHMRTLRRFVKLVSRCHVGWTPALGTNRGPLIHARSAGVKYNSMTADLCVHCKNFWRAWYIRYQTRWIAKDCVSLISSIWMQACLWRSLFFIHCTHSLLWAAPCASCSSKNLQPWTTPFVKTQLPLSLPSVSLASANQNIKPLWPGWSETYLPPINDMSACFWWTCLPWRLFGYSVQLYQMIFGTRTQHQS